MTANDLKLYHWIASSISRWVHIVRAEKGLTVPSLLVDLGMGEQHFEATVLSIRTTYAHILFGGWQRGDAHP